MRNNSQIQPDCGFREYVYYVAGHGAKFGWLLPLLAAAAALSCKMVAMVHGGDQVMDVNGGNVLISFLKWLLIVPISRRTSQ